MENKDWIDQATENRIIKTIILIGAVYFGFYALSKITEVLISFYQAEGGETLESVVATLKSVGLLILALVVIYLGLVLYSMIRRQKELEEYLEEQIREPELIEKKELQRYVSKQALRKIQQRLDYLAVAFRLLSIKHAGTKKAVTLIRERRRTMIEILQQKGVKEEKAREVALELYPDPD